MAAGGRRQAAGGRRQERARFCHTDPGCHDVDEIEASQHHGDGIELKGCMQPSCRRGSVVGV